MAAKAQQAIKYFRGCYEADNRQLGVRNWTGQKTEHCGYWEGHEQLVNAELPWLPVNSYWAQPVLEELKTNGREKVLLYGALLVAGAIKQGRGWSHVLAPLLLYPAHINHLPVQKGRPKAEYHLEVKLNTYFLNPEALRYLDCNLKEGTVLDTVAEKLPDGPLEFNNVAKIVRLLSGLFTNLETEEAMVWPQIPQGENLFTDEFKKSLEGKEGFRLLSWTGMGLVKRSRDTLGVLDELQQMARVKKHSPPITALLEETSPPSVPTLKQGLTPAILSAPQERAVNSMRRYPQTLVVGPPGTGKSFTIASLAVELLSQGYTVLVAGKSTQAVDVIADKIERQLGLGNVTVRGGSGNYRQQLAKYVDSLLSGIGLKAVDSEEMKQWEQRLNKIESRLATLEKQFTAQTQQEEAWGEWLVETRAKQGLMTRLKKKAILWKNTKRAELFELVAEMEELLRMREHHVGRLLEMRYFLKLQRMLYRNRKSVMQFLKALRAHNLTRKEELFRATSMEAVLTMFPIWLVNLTEVNAVLPLEQEMFDVVIIDEASQADVASALPILYRGQRVVYAGDPQQLRHISFLSRSRQEMLRQQHKLPEDSWTNYRNSSILDLAMEHIANQEQVVYLDEHYRSHPHIIGFSNTQFYRSSLRVMTTTPRLLGELAVFVQQVEGKRDKKGLNKAEANAILDHMERLMAEDHAGEPMSFGLLSPFRAQVNYLDKAVQERFTAEQHSRYRIKVGTAHSFQGEERDVMFLSFAVDANSHNQTQVHLNQADLFNVAITRARMEQHVYLSLDHNSLGVESLLRQYVEWAKAPVAEAKPSKNTARDKFLNEVTKALEKMGVGPLWVGFPVAGLALDVVFLHNGKTLAVDLIGYPGQFMEAFTLERYKMLARAGIRIFPMSYVDWVQHRKRCQQALTTFIFGEE